MKVAVLILVIVISPFALQAQDDHSKELSDFLFDFGIVANALTVSDSVFMEYFDDATNGYEEAETYYRNLFWESSKKQLQLIYRDLDYAHNAISRMIKQLYDWDLCTATTSELQLVDKELLKMQNICDELYKNSWDFYSVESFVRYNKPKGDAYYSLFETIYGRCASIQDALNDCFDE